MKKNVPGKYIPFDVTKRARQRWDELHNYFHMMDLYIQEYGDDGSGSIAFMLACRELMVSGMYLEKALMKKGKKRKVPLKRMATPTVKM